MDEKEVEMAKKTLFWELMYYVGLLVNKMILLVTNIISKSMSITVFSKLFI